jgi:hypothetical protein
MSFMFKWDELEELKQGALQRDDYIEYLAYVSEQLLREIKSIGWKLKEINDRGGL